MNQTINLVIKKSFNDLVLSDTESPKEASVRNVNNSIVRQNGESQTTSGQSNSN